jgi:hypothetical protein
MRNVDNFGRASRTATYAVNDCLWIA